MNYYLKYMIVSLALIMALGCEVIGSLNSLEPENVLMDKTLITDAKSAEIALGGVYKSWRNFEFSGLRNCFDCLTRVENTFSSIMGAEDFRTNNVQTDNWANEQYYVKLYYVLNSANTVIAAVEGKAHIPGLSDARKNEILAEAIFNRALATLMLLRSYGEFYDTNSANGIVLWRESVRGNIAKARSSVSDVYMAVTEDLKFVEKYAAKKVPGAWYISQATGYALHARTALYMRDYEQASLLADMALQAAEEGGYLLESDYLNVFANSFDSKELLFCLYTQKPYQKFNDFWYNFAAQGPGDGIKKVADELVSGDGNITTGQGYDKRFSQIFAVVNQTGINGINKYVKDDYTIGERGNTWYFMRLAEVNYIKAEAEVRLGRYNNARNALKGVLERAGYAPDYITGVPDENMLLLILKHKYVELAAENNEDWFDMVRYNRIDGIDFEKLGMSVSMKHLILPIPKAALAGNFLLKQNGTY